GAGLKIVADEDVRTISYNANNGTGTMASDKVATGSSYTVKPNAFTHTGYTFTSWNTEPDGNGTDHEEGEEFPNVTVDITLYAQWVEVTSSSSSEAEPSSSSEEPSSSSEETPSSSSGDNTPIRLPQIANAPISVHATSNAIILQNLPTNAKVEVYNLHGKRVYMGNPVNPKIMKIMVQTGIYIIKVNKNTLRVVVR
ncbi:MAG: InlB B-repeat-containing protein, partial [Fibromonadaceae bacterium]|nr:InlB B-repeat-containing protein [Fibromonadaceae bacterium]